MKDRQGDRRQAPRRETGRQKYREAVRQGDGRQSWRRETVRQGDRDTGRQ